MQDLFGVFGQTAEYNHGQVGQRKNGECESKFRVFLLIVNLHHDKKRTYVAEHAERQQYRIEILDVEETIQIVGEFFGHEIVLIAQHFDHTDIIVDLERLHALHDVHAKFGGCVLNVIGDVVNVSLREMVVICCCI